MQPSVKRTIYYYMATFTTDVVPRARGQARWADSPTEKPDYDSDAGSSPGAARDFSPRVNIPVPTF